MSLAHYMGNLLTVVGAADQSLTELSGFSAANFWGSGSSVPQANTTGFTCWVVITPAVSSTNQILFQRSNGTGASKTDGWAIEMNGGWQFSVGTGASRVNSAQIGVSGEEVGKFGVLHGVVRSGFIYLYKNGVVMGPGTAISSYGTTSTNGRIAGNGSEYYRGGVIAAGIASLTGLDDAQVLAHYDAIVLDAYAQSPSCTNLWRSDQEAASWVDSVGGITLARQGTITPTTRQYSFYNQYNPSLYVSDTDLITPQLTNSAGSMDVLPVGDSRTTGVGGTGNTHSYRNGVSLALAGDVSNINFVGPNTSDAVDPNHDGVSGWTAGQHLSGVGGQISLSVALTNYNPDMAIVWIGTNNAGGDVGIATAKADYLTLITLIKDFNSDIRIVVFDETHHTDPFYRARLQEYNYWLWNTAWPALEAAGCKLTRLHASPLLLAADLADTVHPNDGGYEKLVTPVYNALRVSAGYSI